MRGHRDHALFDREAGEQLGLPDIPFHFSVIFSGIAAADIDRAEPRHLPVIPRGTILLFTSADRAVVEAPENLLRRQMDTPGCIIHICQSFL